MSLSVSLCLSLSFSLAHFLAASFPLIFSYLRFKMFYHSRFIKSSTFTHLQERHRKFSRRFLRPPSSLGWSVQGPHNVHSQDADSRTAEARQHLGVGIAGEGGQCGYRRVEGGEGEAAEVGWDCAFRRFGVLDLLSRSDGETAPVKPRR